MAIKTDIKLVEANLKPQSNCFIEVKFIREITEDGKVIGTENWRSVMTPDDYQATKINPFNDGEINMPSGLKTLQAVYTSEVRTRYTEFKKAREESNQ